MTATPKKKGSFGCLGGCLLALLPAAFVAGVVFLFWLNPDWLDEAAFWRGPLLAEDMLDPPPPPPLPPPFALREKTPPPDDGSFPLDLSGLPEVERVSSTIFAAQGGEVRLSDGTGVILPPGALPGDRQVTVRRLGGDEPALAVMSVLDVDTGGAELSADATVILPVPPGMPALQQHKMVPRVLHVHGGRVAELPIVSTAAGGQVVVRTRRFSPFTVVLVMEVIAAWSMDVVRMREALYNHLEFSRRDPPLPVPYFSQGNANWCFAASTAMMVHAHGGDVTVSEFAGKFRVEFLTAMSNPQGYWFNSLGDQLKNYQPVVSRAPWMNPPAACLYICANLAEGRPVYVDIFQIQHAVVAVGFNHNGIFIHDPAGTALVYAGFSDVRERLKDGRLAAVMIPWDKFMGIACTAGERIPKPIYTYVLKAPLANRPVSVEVLHDSLTFVHPTPVPYPQKNPWLANYAWDGRMFRGQTFQLVKQDPFWDDRGNWLGMANASATPNHPCNGDKISLRAMVSTPTPPPGPLTVQAFLEDQPIGPPRTVFVPSVGPNTPHLANIQVDLTPLKGDPLPVQVLPGPNKLRVEVRAGGVVADSEEITAQFGPSRPANIRFTPRPDGGTDLEWDPVPEYGVEYKVRLAEKVLSWGRELDSTPSCVWTMPAELLGERKERGWIYVQAVHKNTGLEGVPSDHLDLRDPWEGRWKGKFKLVEGALFETGDYLLDLYVKGMLESENKAEQKIQERLSSATPEAAGRIQQELNEHRESTRKTSEFLNSVKEYLSSLLLIVDFGARAGISMTFDLTRTAESVYEMRLVQIGGLKPENPEPMQMLMAGPNTLGVYELEMLTEDERSKGIRLDPLPRLKLRRWGQCRGDTVISFEMNGKIEQMIFKWEFERVETPQP